MESKSLNKSILHQITINIKRTSGNAFLGRDELRERVIRILYCWSIRRPASGYVQGLNDVVMPLFEVFLQEAITQMNNNTDSSSISTLNNSNQLALLSETVLSDVEGDTFWCFSRLVDSIQDNYTASQAGIHRQIGRMRQVCGELDPELVDHLQVDLGIKFVQFAFRWINCLLVRELRMELIIRAWDTYLCEHAHLMLPHSFPIDGFKEEGGGVGEGASHSSFSTFHTFMCVALLMKFAPDIKEIDDFSDAMLFLQKLPTETWEVRDVELLLSEAYLYQAWYMKNRGFGRK